AVLPGRIMRVSYEALVDDLEAEVRRLLDHCGLDFEPATLRFFDRAGAVRTASSEQVRQPIYRSSIGRGRRFAAWLGPLDQALAEG
ncbi:MAG: sulfotransferase, partial [Sphingomonadales bacterium]|nr:sulfotransferase [Sphingomonadales bacterium]